MHAHNSAAQHTSNLSATGDGNKAPGILENWSDAIVNVFTKVKKPDERFVALRSDASRFEESIGSLERTVTRGRDRASGRYLFAFSQTIRIRQVGVEWS